MVDVLPYKDAENNLKDMYCCEVSEDLFCMSSIDSFNNRVCHCMLPEFK